MNELDQYVRRELKVGCYVRYCDDFGIIPSPRNTFVLRRKYEGIL